MFTFLLRKYPVFKTSYITALVISLSIAVFLLVFQPFGFIYIKGNKLVAALGFAVITFLAIIGVDFIKQHLLKNHIKQWRVGHEIIINCCVLLLIAIGNYIYFLSVINAFNHSVLSFLNTIAITVAIGILPISMITLIRYNQIVRNNLGSILEVEHSNTIATLQLSSINRTEAAISILKQDLLYIEAKGNMILITVCNDAVIQTMSLRNTLKNIELQIDDPTIFKCHRSFLINTAKVKTATGNSNGYKVYFKHYNGFVPVSRTYAKAFKELFF